jgi:hypothetical protein
MKLRANGKQHGVILVGFERACGIHVVTIDAASAALPFQIRPPRHEVVF